MDFLAIERKLLREAERRVQRSLAPGRTDGDDRRAMRAASGKAKTNLGTLLNEALRTTGRIEEAK